MIAIGIQCPCRRNVELHGSGKGMKYSIFKDLLRFFKNGIEPDYRPVDFLMPGFKVNQIAETGISVIDNFCSREEAEYIIKVAKPALNPSKIVVNNESVLNDYRSSSTASVYNEMYKDPALLPLLFRAAMICGVPYTHVETVFVTRYSSREFYKSHEDFFPGFQGDRLYTVLVYLNDMEPEEGGSTTFEKLRLGATPKCGRAISWTNRNPDRSTHPETTHEALPVAEGAEKWAIQLWFRRYEMISPVDQLPTSPNYQVHQPVAANATLPDGVRRLSAEVKS